MYPVGAGKTTPPPIGRKADITMKKQRISLDLWQILQGTGQLDGEELLLKPDSGGFIRMELKGEPAGMGGVKWTPEQYLVIDLLADMDAMTTVDVCFFPEHPAEKDEKVGS